MRSEYEIHNKDNKTAFGINEKMIEDLIRICDNRSLKYKKKLIEIWEHLEQRKFDEKKILGD